MKKLKIGDRIRLKVPTISGWKGNATVTKDQIGDTVTFRKDDAPELSTENSNYCCRHEVSVRRLAFSEKLRRASSPEDLTWMIFAETEKTPSPIR